MRYDYASWDDDNYPDSTVVMSVGERAILGEEALEITLKVMDTPGFTVELYFTFSPEDEERFRDLLLKRWVATSTPT